MAALELDTAGNVPMSWNGGHGVFAFSTGSCLCGAANAIVDMDESGGNDWLALAGYTTYSGGQDFTLAELTDSGALENGGTGTDPVYKGLAIGNNSRGLFLYATNFRTGKIAVWNSTFGADATLNAKFIDNTIPSTFAP